MFSFFKKEDPKTIIDGIDKAQKMLDERYKNKLISSDIYMKQTAEFSKKKEKYLKQMGKSKYDVD